MRAPVLVLVLLVVEGPDFWTLEWEAGPLFEYFEPTDPLGVLVDEDNLVELESLLGLDRRSEDEDDGASVPIEDPTG